LEYLSNIELYYSDLEARDEIIIVSGEEFKHISKVMRHSPGDEIFVTDGEGKIFKGVIEKILKDFAEVRIAETLSYVNKKKEFTFCLPRLKNPERFEFALEKSAELGITTFIVFNSSRTISKGIKIDRWNKILLSAMKQSLLSFLPSIRDGGSLKDLIRLEGEKIIFDQSGKRKFARNMVKPGGKYYFIFGPEGGLTRDELNFFNEDNIVKLSENRLRTETAVVKCAASL